ncbi:MAG: hypothetical protein JNJ57_12080 [Saprospiraceae bacterium]|nr:hypothetical protein [Saprospiraceae bacterium]
MKNIFLTGALAFLFNLSSGWGQSLYEDAQRLSRAVNILKDRNIQSDSSVRIQAAADLIAVLQQYDGNLENNVVQIGAWEELRRRYDANPLLSSVLQDSLNMPSVNVDKEVTEAARLVAQVLNSGIRQDILDKLYAPQAVSPADYLSAPNALTKYQLPVLPETSSMQMAAENSNANVQKGALISQALLIEGLAQFILSRAKDEVVINFLDRLLQDELPDLKSLFPTVISEFNDADFTYSESFISRLRQSFYEDLQKLSVRLPLLMLEDDYFAPLQADPLAYNIMAIYSLIGETQLGLAVQESVPATHRFLYEVFSEKNKELNLVLSEQAADSDTYKKLMSLSQVVNNQLKSIFLGLNNAEASIMDTLIDFQPSIDPVSTMPNVNDYLGSIRYDLNVLWGEGEFGLNLLPQLLRGEFDETYMKDVNTLANYDKFFGVDRTPAQMRGAGLELAQKLNGAWYNGESMADILSDWLKDLTRYQNAVELWMIQNDPAGKFKREQQNFKNDLEVIRKLIGAEKKFWLDNGGLDNTRQIAFDVLGNLLNDNALQNLEALLDIEAITNPKLGANKNAVLLARQKELLANVLDRLSDLDAALYAQNGKLAMASPLRLYKIGQRTAKPYANIESGIANLKSSLAEMNGLLEELEKTFANTTRLERDNAKPFLQISEIASALMYCLSSNDPNQKWLTREQLDEMLNGDVQESIYLGLLQQRLSRINGVGPLSASGLSEFIRVTLQDVTLLPKDQGTVKDSMADYKKAAFSINMLNRVLELPLIKDPKSQKFTPLIEWNANLANVPGISEQLLNFIYYLNIKEHRQAMSSLIRLFTGLDLSILSKGKADSKKANKRAAAIEFLQKYGDFIAGLIDAKTGEEVKALLDIIADPPGSSSLKRTQALTVGLNGYLGANVGKERWSGDALTTDHSFWSLAPTMPVGATLAGRLGKDGPSMSIYIAFLDLGGLINYAPTSKDDAESTYNFKNMFKPGVQLHWNLNNSPFYLGAGWQYGPQTITMDQRTSTVGSNRYFFSFGIDTPILTLYRR